MGNLLIVLYMVLSAAKAVYLSHLLQSLDPIVVLFHTFLIAWVIFLIVARINGRILLLVRFIADNKRSILLFNLFTATSWGTYFAAVKLLEPSAHAVIANASQPLVALLLPGAVALGSMKAGRTLYRGGLLLILIGVLLQISVILLGQASLRNLSIQRAVLGLSMSAMCAASLALNRRVNYNLQNTGLRASDLMGVRFMGLLAVALLVRFQDVGLTAGSAAIIMENWWKIGVIGLIGVTLPVYLLQKGQTLTDEFSAALVTSLMPLAMLSIQALDARFTFSFGSIAATVLATIGTFCVLLAKRYAQPKKGAAS